MFSFPKMSNMVKAKIFRKVFAFKQTKEHILLQVQPLIMLNILFCVADFRVTGKIL